MCQAFLRLMSARIAPRIQCGRTTSSGALKDIMLRSRMSIAASSTAWSRLFVTELSGPKPGATAPWFGMTIAAPACATTCAMMFWLISYSCLVSRPSVQVETTSG